jgi:hypothetical protein
MIMLYSPMPMTHNTQRAGAVVVNSKVITITIVRSTPIPLYT